MYKAGAKVIIQKKLYGHEFNIGDIVILLQNRMNGVGKTMDNNQNYYLAGKTFYALRINTWYVYEDEIKSYLPYILKKL